MHRIAHLPGIGPSEEKALIEQRKAPVIFLTSASTDISTLASAIDLPELSHWKDKIRALELSSLDHPAQIDHYIATTCSTANLVTVRLLGGRSHWSYGLDQLIRWQQDGEDRELLIISGTSEQELELHSLSSQSTKTCKLVAELIREGGIENIKSVLEVFECLTSKRKLNLNDIDVLISPDPFTWDWKKEEYKKIGIIYYRSLFKANDLEYPKALNRDLRRMGLSPRSVFVSNLRDNSVQKAIIDIFKRENISVLLTTTSFSSVRSFENGLDSTIWDEIGVPVLQLLSSSRTKKEWEISDIGLNPTDLSLQVVLPEIDGRITTRPCSFKEVKKIDNCLSTTISKTIPNSAGIKWIVDHAYAWTKLQETKVENQKVTIVLANYPTKDGRLANGVGLDTPNSLAEILNWLKISRYDLGLFENNMDGNSILSVILNKRTNDPTSNHKKPLTYIPLEEYLNWWNKLPRVAKERIEQRWGTPVNAEDLEEQGFAIHGIRFGKITILIQPSRGYDGDKISDLHSPDLPPPHRYLAQYLWISEINRSNVIVHLGKHGSLEWLPGKSIGLSESCYPHIGIKHIPHIYPFIVNDPGEGTQAKRRSNAVIIDHLTPPLSRSGLYGDLLILESLLDEYIESTNLSAKRSKLLQEKLIKLIKVNNFPGLPNHSLEGPKQLDNIFDSIEAYLCELKESQIRSGLHILGKNPTIESRHELLVGLARPPSPNLVGLTQKMAIILNLDCDPWEDEESNSLSLKDKEIAKELNIQKARKIGDIVSYLEDQAIVIVGLLVSGDNYLSSLTTATKLNNKFHLWLNSKPRDPLLERIKNDLWPRLDSCADHEKDSFLKAVRGYRVTSGPSGAPTRGRPEVLPTGRNFYSVDLRGLPTESAWDLGRRSAENLLELYLQDEGEDLRKLAMTVWGTATMRNGGEDIAQLLALIGVKPVWDGPSRRMIDLEVIPLEILQRPRVDVTLRISGLFRDAFPNLISWVYKAQYAVSQLNEPVEFNPTIIHSKEKIFKAKIYGSAPQAYGAGLQGFIESGSWEKRTDLGNAFLEWSKWRYDGSQDAKCDLDGLKNSLDNVQVVLHNQDNREHDILDSDDYYQFHGGLSAAIEKISGKKPDLWIGDNSRHQRPRMHKLEKEIDKVIRTRLLNPKWIDAMKKHGYKGAFEMSASLDYLFAYDASTDRIDDWYYSAICESWLKNKATQKFISDNNPWALKDIAERLLEASNRGMWKTHTNSELELLKEIIIETESQIEKGEVLYQ